MTKYCIECIHYHQEHNFCSKYGYCEIKDTKSDRIKMRLTYTKACRKYEENNEKRNQ